MPRAFQTSRFVPCFHNLAIDGGKAFLGSVCWFVGGVVGGLGPSGFAALCVLCLSVHLLWSIGCCVDGARMIAAAGVAAIIVGTMVLIVQGILEAEAPPFAALGAVMHMAPAWSHPATPFARVSR